MNRVLIVDDKEENVYYLQALLGGHGFEVETARHGAEALVKARQSPPDLIVSDLLMPVMDGYTLLRHWKGDELLRAIPFIVYTATYTEAEDERLALNLGADAFILKPAEPEDFLSRIRAVQAGHSAAATVPMHTQGDEKELLKVYSETLIRKLEEKTLQLEHSNHALQLDIAQRTRTEEELRESEERFRATFEQAAVGIGHVDLEGRFLRVNDKLCAITGYTRSELLALTVKDLTLADERPESEAARLAMLARTRVDYTAERRYQRKGGEIFWVNAVTTLLRDKTDSPKYFISVIADISERKQLEQQFLRAQRMESIGTLAGGIAHDLNNLLSPIMLGVNILRFEKLGPESRLILDNMEVSAKRAANLVRQVLSFARGVEGRRVPLQIRHVIREVESIAASTFPKNITFKHNLAPNLWPVVGDPTQLHQVILNLCVNARDAMPEGGSLSLGAANVELDAHYAAMNPGLNTGPHVLIEINDTGSGIPRAIIDRIFEPFFTTKEVGKGTGLGLSTVLGIVRGHGGSVTVYSEPGQGTTFKIYLPAQIDGGAVGGTSPTKEKLPAGNGELVLVVDDESAILDVTRKTLEAFGYRVRTARDGVQALGVYMQHADEVALVVTDLMMPTMDGATLIATLRTIQPDTRIIAVSGLGLHKNAAGTTADTPYFLLKPYTAETLLTLIHRVLGERGSVPPRP